MTPAEALAALRAAEPGDEVLVTDAAGAVTRWRVLGRELLDKGALPVDDARRTRFAWAPDPLPRKGWGLELAELGRKRIEEGNWDPVDFGPEYVRASDAELGITAPQGA